MKYREKLCDEVKYLGSQDNIVYLDYGSIANKSMKRINAK